MSNLQTYYHLILDFQKMGQYTGDKWLFHSTKHREDNQLRSLELPCTHANTTKFQKGRFSGQFHLILHIR